jgi:hypothetical protein
MVLVSTRINLRKIMNHGQLNSNNVNISNKINNSVNNSASANQFFNTNNKNKKVKTIKQIKAIHVNCNSIVGKLEMLKVLINREKPDILSLNEIKCTETTANDIFNIDNYLPYYKCRTEHGGGVCLLIRDSIESEEIKIPFEELEIIGARIKIKSKYYAIFSYYNPPYKDLNVAFFRYVEYLVQGIFGSR